MGRELDSRLLPSANFLFAAVTILSLKWAKLGNYHWCDKQKGWADRRTDSATHWRNFTLKSGGDQWRRQDLVSVSGARRSRRRRREDRGAKGAEWVGYGEGCPLPCRLWRLGERRELPSGVRPGRSPGPAAIAFSAYFRPQNASGSKKNTILLPKV